MSTRILVTLFAALSVSTASIGGDAPTAFTYQGELQDGGSPAAGNWDFEFELFDSDVGGSTLAGVVAQTLLLNDGVFTTQLDFGDVPFDGGAVWLEVRARPAGMGGFTTLSPRQEITAAPYALSARSISASCPSGTAIRSVAPDGTPSCEATGGAGFWDLLPDDRIQSDRGVRIQPDPLALYPFTVRHDSALNSPQIAITETSVDDYTRFSFYNDNYFERYWTIAARILGESADDDVLNIYNRGANGGLGADILSVRGSRRVGINTRNPEQTFHVVGGPVRIDDLAHGEPQPAPVMANEFGDLMVQSPAPSRFISLGPPAFVGQSNFDYQIFNGAIWGISADASLFARVPLPHGSRIKGLTVTFVDNLPGQEFYAFLYKGSNTDRNNIQIIINIQSSEDTTDEQTHQQNLVTPEFVSNEFFNYNLAVGFTSGGWPAGAGANAAVISAVIEYMP